jgi:hypothetical protein
MLSKKKIAESAVKGGNRMYFKKYKPKKKE